MDQNILGLLHGQVPCSSCLAQARVAWQLPNCAEVGRSALEVRAEGTSQLKQHKTK